MYAEYYGFRELPFNNTPDPRFFYSTPDHEEALASLIYAVKERKGFVLLTGEVGAGKTLVTRLMLRHFGTHVCFATINHAVQGPEDLLESICNEFELTVPSEATPAQLVRVLHDYLLSQFAQNIPVVLILDEAQNLSVQGFEQLRMIGNLEADDAKLLQIAIVGQPELQTLFRSRQLRQLRQRLFRAFHLAAMSRQNVETYIQHRLSVVSSEPQDIFDDGAFEVIYQVSRGLPRIINTVCDNALLSAYSADRRRIDAAFVRSVVSQMTLAEDGAEADVPSAPAPTGRFGSSRAVKPLPEPAYRTRSIDVVRGAAASPPASDVPDVLRLVRRELGSVSHQLRAEFGDVAKRFDFATRRVAGDSVDLASARAVHESLKPLVEQARCVTSRAEDTIRELEGREDRLRKLGDTVGTIVRDLRRLLDRANEVSASTDRAEHRARATHDRLTTQTQRAREIARHVTGLASSVKSSTVSDGVDAVLLNERAASIESLGSRAISSRLSGEAVDRGGVRRLLDDTRRSLSSLRDLTVEPAERLAADESKMAPTNRLAAKLDNLLASVATGETFVAVPAASS